MTSSRSVSPVGTPPYPGPGIDGIPSIADLDDSRATGTSGFGVGVGLLFDGPSDEPPPRGRTAVPDPYGPSSDSETELEADLDQVAQVRRSLIGSSRGPRNAKNKKGWLAYQSVFPSSSSSEATESEKETEDESGDERIGMMGQSRRKSHPRADALPVLSGASETLEEPLLGPDEITQMTTKVPVRLQVYHGRFGHWEREGLRKYKGMPSSLNLSLRDRPRVLGPLADNVAECDDRPVVRVGLNRRRCTGCDKRLTCSPRTAPLDRRLPLCLFSPSSSH